MSHDTASPDTAVALDGWKALVATVAPRSPQLSVGGDVAYIATDDPAVGARVRIVAPTGAAAERSMGEHPEHTPRWSPSGRQLAFIAAPPEGDEVHVVGPDGSARATVAAGDGQRVDDLQWIDEGCLALIAAPQITDTAVGRGSQRGSAGAGPLVCTNDRLRRRLVTVDLSTGRAQPIDTGPATVWEVCPLGGERFVAIVSDDPTESGWYAARLSMLDRVGGEQPLHQSAWQIAAPRVSPDGSRVALVEGWSSDRGFVAGGVVVIDLLERSTTAWSIDDLDVTGLEWVDDRALHVHGWRGTRSARGTVGRDGDQASVVVDEDVLRETTIGRAAVPVATAAVMERAGAPARVVVGSGERGWSTVGAPPPAAALELSIDELWWTAADGTELHGLLLTRADADRGTGVPVLHLHGGPANLWTRAASAGAAALAWSGYAVILPNPRGSVGRGQGFARANLGDPGGRELDDALDAVAMCRRAGLVADRAPAVVGGSYGGYLTAAAAVLRRDVAAAVVMYGHPDLVSARYGSNNPAFYDILLGGPPTDGTFALYCDRSPVFHAHRDVPPTLILHGDGDRCTPVGQADELFRALLERDVTVELVVYPGEGHGLRSPAAQVDAWERTIAWFDQHARHGAHR